jgi:hypothetical protein
MKNYRGLVAKVLEGNLAPAAQEIFDQREVLDSSDSSVLQRQLIAFRIALKSGNSQISVDALQESRTKDPFLRAEILFFKGSYFGQFHEPMKARDYFAAARVLFLACGEVEKSHLAEFNELMSGSNLKAYTFAEELALFHNLLVRLEENYSGKVAFLCRRHLSYRHFDQGNWVEAIDILSLPTLTQAEAMSLSRSDLDLGCIHLADCFLESGNLRRAIELYDSVPTNTDERVRFPRAMIGAKIFRTPVDPTQYTYVSDYWKARFASQPQWESNSAKAPPTSDMIRSTSKKDRSKLRWDQRTGYLLSRNRLLGRIRPLSLEGQLLSLLIAAPRTKTYLCETLWPHDLDCDYLDDRFHQLVLRTNRKTSRLIVFDGQFYRLAYNGFQ